MSKVHPAPCGQAYTLVIAAYLKWSLQFLPREYYLETLEGLAQLADSVGAAAIEAVQPFDDATARMVEEAFDLPPDQPWQTTSAGFRVVSTNPVWPQLCALNPSLDKAMKLIGGWGVAAAA